MITDAQYFEQEAELLAIFERDAAQTKAREKSTPDARERAEAQAVRREVAKEARIQRILEMAQYEVVLKDTTSFLFLTFGAGIDGLAKAAFGALDPATRKGEPPSDSTDIKNTKGVTH